ncbi:Clavaminate synthase-like protein [Plenodomus tracheiphilus IPT5]|uniref:Clavaminate synthase-like protein n=1 Tax=Plenodomus tracheiphilus IPT5 TaxID=1408161 RepID=A0A6A7B315_9PLEO|nr:Clavaminate synthase-like protein [Plenodomus tracheiphilus IPT5]
MVNPSESTLETTPDHQRMRTEDPSDSESNPSPSLPIIDISPFMNPHATRESRQSTATALNDACINYGFFYLTGHGIPLSTLNHIISLARTFFARPLSEKMLIKRFDAGGPEGGDSARGYQAVGENVSDGLQDMQEAVDWYAPWSEEKKEVGPGGSVKVLQGENLWPSRPEEMRRVYEGYVEEVKRVGEAVVWAMGVGLGLGSRKSRVNEDADRNEDEEDEEIFVRKCKDSFWVMRAINYPPLPASFSTKHPTSNSSDTSASSDANKDYPTTTTTDQTPQFSCGAHTDYGCITLLLSDPTPSALQVRLKNDTWLAADPIPGAFVVNIGDMIERWTNGLYKSTLHRVIHTGGRNGEGRISVPFFYEPGFDVEVRALGKVVQRMGGVRVGGAGTYGDHLLTKVFSNFYYSKRTDW